MKQQNPFNTSNKRHFDSHEVANQRVTKRIKSIPHDKSFSVHKSYPSSCIALPQVDDDVLSFVMQFLSPKELHAFSLTPNKSVVSKITIPLVVRSALMQGGNAAATIKNLYPLMKAQCIHPPSALRLLQLVNGRKCEHCLCTKVRHIRPGYGMFICQTCSTDKLIVNDIKISAEKYRGNVRYSKILKHPRVVAIQSGVSKFRTWKNPTFNHDGTECYGPCVTHMDIETIACGKNTQSVNDMMNKMLPQSEKYAAFLTAYESNIEDGDKAEQARQQKKYQARQEARSKRKAKCLQIICKIQNRLHKPWKDYALAKKETNLGGNHPCYTFMSPLCERLIREYCIHPSKANEANIRNIAETINRCFKLLLDSKMVGFVFLSEEDPFERELKRYCCTNLSLSLKDLILHPNATYDFYQLIEKGQFVESLELIIGTFGRILMDDDDAESNDRNSGNSLAINVWNYEYEKNQRRLAVDNDSTYEINTDASLCSNKILWSNTYATAILSMQKIKKAVDDFLEVLNRKYPGGHFDNDYLRVKLLTYPEYVGYLDERNFNDLSKIIAAPLLTLLSLRK